MSKNVFITATDTDAGKTFISALIIRKLIKLKKNCAYIKPVETGLGNELIPIDYNFVKSINPRLKISADESVIERLVYPLSPYDSAVKQGIKINVKNIFQKTLETAKKYDYNVIEGAGGLYVPITDNYNIIDFIKDLSFPAVVVGRSSLGTINHSVLTIKALQNQNINVNCFILTGRDYTAGVRNAENIKRLTGIECAGIVPEITEINAREIDKLNVDIDLIF
jgi:dethiobiotin synthetase